MPGEPSKNTVRPVAEWSVRNSDGTVYGPFIWSQLKEFASDRRLALDCQLHHTKKTKDRWVPLKCAPGLFEIAKSAVVKVPPVLPVKKQIVGGRLPKISPSQLQVPGEVSTLHYSLVGCALVLLFVSLSTGMVFLLVLAVSHFEVKWMQEKVRKTAQKIDSKSNPVLTDMVQTAAIRLTMPTPDLFVVENDEINAYATGYGQNGMIVVYSGLLERMTGDEVLFIIGHELTHLKCQHCKFLLFTNSTTGAGGFVHNAVAIVFDLVFKAWSRKCEFTCDRGGVIACKNPSAAMLALAKLEANDNEIAHKFVLAALESKGQANNLLATHPETANRISAINEYVSCHDFHSLTSLSLV